MQVNKSMVSTISILLLILGCSNKIDRVEKDGKISARENRVSDAVSPYRYNLRLLGKFKEKVPMANVIQETASGKCKIEGVYNDGKERCISISTLKTEYKKSKCINGNQVKTEEVIENKLNKNTVIKTYYQCIDNKEEKSQKKKVEQHLILKDKRYISVSRIINKSASKKLPTNIDTLVKNSINNISSNYVLVDSENIRNNEYRIEGAITGFDTPYERSNSMSENLYGGKGRGEFDIGGGNDDSIVLADLSIDFIMKKYNKGLESWEYVKNVSTSKKIKLLKTSKGYSFSFGVMGGGISLSESVSTTNGLAFITRALVERSILELLGKLDDLPYWSFLPNASQNIDENWNQLLEEHYRKSIPDNKSYYETLTKNLLNVWNPREKNSLLTSRIKDYKKYYSTSFIGQVNEEIDEIFIVHLLNRIPLVLSRGKLEQKKKTINNDYSL